MGGFCWKSRPRSVYERVSHSTRFLWRGKWRNSGRWVVRIQTLVYFSSWPFLLAFILSRLVSEPCPTWPPHAANGHFASFLRLSLPLFNALFCASLQCLRADCCNHSASRCPMCSPKKTARMLNSHTLPASTIALTSVSDKWLVLGPKIKCTSSTLTDIDSEKSFQAEI